MEATFLLIIEVLGTLAFGVSGVRLAAKKRFDWFGAYTIGIITAIGGGTIRDLLLDVPVFWMQTWLYLAVTGLSFLSTWLLPRAGMVFHPCTQRDVFHHREAHKRPAHPPCRL